MENKPELIRQEMQDTRSALTEKLEALEQHVLDSVQNATCAVQDTVSQVKDAVEGTVSNVKESIGDTVDTVKETFDVELQIQRHPWGMMAGAVCAGFIGGKVMQRLTPPVTYAPPAATTFAGGEDRTTTTRVQEGGFDSWGESLRTSFGPEIDKLKAVAVGAFFNIVKDMTRRWTPHALESQIAELLDGLTHKMGGRPLEGSLTEELQSTFR